MPEAFISLARKWRPRRLADMVGQEYIVRALQNGARDNRLHHALLFSGTRGIGKTTLARIVAMLINCSRRAPESGEPCLECDFCRDIMAGRLTDVIEQDAASHTQVDKMRELLESAAYAPARAAYKVFIIDEAHMLTRQSFNAMLKTLEEPPPHVKFILATTDPEKLPATVRSRCLCFALQPLDQAQISGRLSYILNEEKILFQPAAVAAVARLAGGSMRDALSILDQAVAYRDGELQADDVNRIAGVIGIEPLATILRAVADSDAVQISEMTAYHTTRHISFDVSLARLAALIYKIALTQAVEKADIADDEEEAAVIAEIGARLSAEQLQVLYEIALRGRQQLPLAPDAATGFMMTLLRMTLFTPSAAPPDTALTAAPAATAPAPASASPAAALSAAAAVSSTAPVSWKQIETRLGEMARALTNYCIVKQCDSTGVTLVLDKEQAALTDRFQPALEEDVARLCGSEFKVSVVLGENNAAAVGAKNERLQKVRGHPFFHAIQENFPGAALQEDSVRAIDP